MNNFPLLSTLIWLPVLGAIFILAVGDRKTEIVKTIAVVIALLSMLLCVPLWLGFSSTTADMQFTEHLVWASSLGIHYDLGVDGIAMPLVILSAFTTLIVVIAGLHTIKKKVAQYFATFLVMQGMMVGVFCALDAILFYVFWEAILVPMFICIGVWGSSNRVYASMKFFLYTFLGSAIMLAALLYLHFKSNSFAISDFYPTKLTMNEQHILFCALFLGFAVKIPMWPFHTWLPDAHTEAPAGGSIVLAALMLKMGVYGFLRFTMPITPDASASLANVMIGLSLIAIVYIGFVAIVQKDMKKLIAYSSIAHMGFATLGCFMIYIIVNATHNTQDAYISVEGSIFQMLAHAFSSGAMFLGVGVLYERMHTRLISDYGGVANKMPIFAAMYMVFAMSNVGLPGTAGFVGEFMVILSSFRASFWVAFLAAMSLILGAAYTLWMYKRVFYGEVANAHVQELKDINGLDKLAFGLLMAAVLFFGFYPAPLLNVFHATVEHLIQLSLTSKLPL